MKQYNIFILLFALNYICAMEQSDNSEGLIYSLFRTPSSKIKRTKKELQRSAQLAQALTELRESDSMLRKLTVTGAYIDDIFDKYKNPRYKKP